MSARLVIIGLKTVAFIALSIVMVATVYGYRLDDTGVIARTGIVDISFVPRDAELFVDGARVESAGGKAVLPLSVGNHDIAVRKLGFQPVRKTLVVDGTTANRMGTVYLAPVREALSWSGHTALDGQEGTVGPQCEPETVLHVQGKEVIKNAKVVTVDAKVVSHDAAALFATRDTVLVGSEFSLLAVNPVTGVTTTLHRFDARIAHVVSGPSDENVFVATARDVALCSLPNAVCTHVLHSPEDIRSVSYDAGTRRLSLASDGNQRMEAEFDQWSTGFFGF